MGVEAGKLLQEVKWQACANCGGAGPKEGEMLVKRRKAPTCSFWGKRTQKAQEGGGWSCKEERNREALGASYALERFDYPIGQKGKKANRMKKK